MPQMKISNTENHQNYYMTKIMCPMGSLYNYGIRTIFQLNRVSFDFNVIGKWSE